MILTHSGAEAKASSFISRAGHNAWLPLNDLEQAAFPGYLFVELQDTTDIRKLKGLKGVLTVVKRGEDYALASDSLIHDLKRRHWDGSDDFAIGKRVVTNDLMAPYAGIEASIHARYSDHYILHTIENGKLITIKAGIRAVDAV